MRTAPRRASPTTATAWSPPCGPHGATASYTYDANGHMTSFTDGRGNTSTFVYADGNLTSATDANGAVTTYTYDRAGNRTSMTDSEGNVTKYAYDEQAA